MFIIYMIKSNQPRQVYYDIQINNFQSTGNINQQLRFTESRQAPIIKNSGDYSLSIVRFQLDTYSLPSFIANIEPTPNTDPNKMIETITLEYDNEGVLTTIGPLNMIWTPTNAHIPVPSAPSPLQDNSSEYYYGNSFRHYCDLMNVCFSSLTTALKTAVGATLNDMLAPQMIWNEQQQIGELFAQEEFYNWSRSKHVNIYFNRPLYGNWTSLPALKNFNNADNKIYKIYMKDDLNTKIFSLDVSGSDVDFIKTSQEYSTISNWSPVSSIVFTSGTLPIVETQMSEILVYSNGLAVSQNLPQNFAPVISDMATNEMVYKPNLLYVPSAQYRFIDMIGNNDIKTVNINVYWKDKKGNLVPFILQSGASASIKLLFELKK
jgi:hypothetical protein